LIWLLSPIGRKIAIGAALVAILASGLWWVRYDAVRDDRAAREAAEAMHRLEDVAATRGRRDDAQKLDDDGLLDALSRWMRPDNE
jgi:hypothetical protein